MIHFDYSPFSSVSLYGGTYTADASLWEDEYQEALYEFTLEHIVQDDSESQVNITWVDDAPNNAKDIEEEIIIKFLKQT